MKTHKLTLLAFAAIAAMATSCSNDEVTDNNNFKGIVIKATAGTPAPGANTRLTHTPNTTNPVESMDIVWAANDAFTLYGGTEKHDYTLTDGSGTASASFASSDTWAVSPTNVYALYPTNTTVNPAAITLSLEGQDGTLTGENGLKKFNYMTAAATYTTGDLALGTFTHQVAIVKLVLTISDATATQATNVGLKANGLNKSVQMDLTSNNAINNTTAGDITIATCAIDNGAITAYLCVFPGNLANAKAVATVNGSNYEAALADCTITAGQMYTVTATLAGKTHPADAFDNEAPNGDGDGSAEKPYEIATKEQLALLATRVNGSLTAQYHTLHYILTSDIDLNNEEWTPIATSNPPFNSSFNGVFNGNGHTISGLKIDDNFLPRAGLFGLIGSGGVIYALNVSGTVTISGGYAGGICGECALNSIIAGCSFSGTVHGNNSTGGIAGYTSDGKIIGCYSTATSVTGGDAGGIVGVNDTGTEGNYYCFWQAGTNVPIIASDYETETCEMFTADQGISEAQVNKMNAALVEKGYTNFKWKYTAGSKLPVLEMEP